MAGRMFEFLWRLEGKQGVHNGNGKDVAELLGSGAVENFTMLSTIYFIVLNLFVCASEKNREYGDIWAVDRAKEIYNRFINCVSDKNAVCRETGETIKCLVIITPTTAK